MRRYTITVQAPTPDAEPEKPIDEVCFVDDAEAIAVARKVRDRFPDRYVELVRHEPVWDSASADMFSVPA